MNIKTIVEWVKPLKKRRSCQRRSRRRCIKVTVAGPAHLVNSLPIRCETSMVRLTSESRAPCRGNHSNSHSLRRILGSSRARATIRASIYYRMEFPRRITTRRSRDSSCALARHPISLGNRLILIICAERSLERRLRSKGLWRTRGRPIAMRTRISHHLLANCPKRF